MVARLHAPVVDRHARHRLNEISRHAEAGLTDLRDAIARLQNIERRWLDGDIPDSVSFNNASGRVTDAAWHLGAAVAIAHAAVQCSNEDLLVALQGNTFFTEPKIE